MSYFDDASLVMIPSGYKTSKVYSVKPTDGSGDLTFSRSNDTATRVNSAGLIEKVRTNLLPYSQAFNDATWIKTSSGTGVNPVVTANNATAPDGTMTADTIVFNAGAGTSGSDLSEIYQTLSLSGTLYTGSFYARVTSGTGQLVFRHALGGAYTKANLTTTWQRFSSAEAFGGGTQYFELGIRRAVAEPVNASVTVELWGAQLEVGDVPTDYIATTSAAVSVGPVANVPRLDYLNSSCPRLLLEPQRTNLALYSEQLNNAEYTVSDASFTANATASPDGYTNADLLTENSSNAGHGFYASVVARGTTGASLTTSIFAKSNGRRYINISGGFDSGNYYNVVFDLQTGAVSTTGNAGAGTTPTASIVSYGNGWYRCIVTGSITGLPNRLSFIYLTDATTGNGISGRSYTGNGTSGVYFYGYQIEEGAYATSYIPTLGAAVTRGADAASKTSASALIGQTEGTLFAEFVHNGADILTTQTVISINSGNTQNFVNIGVYDGQLNPAVRASSVDILDLYVGPNPLPAGTHKVALAYKSGDFKIYLNGSAVYTSTAAATFGTMGQLDLGTLLSFGLQLGEGIKQALVFKTRLSNADLAALTA